MGIFSAIKNWFKKGGGFMAESLNSVIDHPKIPVTSEEYARVQTNLKYYRSDFDQVEYTNSNGDRRKRAFVSLPIARTACKKIASLVFNEQAEIILSDQVANEFVNDILAAEHFNKNFERYLESCLALGGLAMRPYVDDDRIKIAFVQAPVFFPLRSTGQNVSESAIVTRTIKGQGKANIYYTLIEFHEWKDDKYVITNELYKSEIKDRVGYRVALSELYDDLEETVSIDGLSRPLFTYLKTPGMNNKDINSSLGLSLFDNAKTTIDFLNRTYDEFAWEIKMGQRRVAVPESTVRVEYGKNGEKEIVSRKFDPDQNVFVQFGNPDIDKGAGITDLTTPIRSDDYIKAISEGLSLFEMQIGVSSGMFTFDGKSMKTATEVVSENSDTYQMRNSIVALVEQSLKELIISICELGKLSHLYSGAIPKSDDISINLDDGVFTDRQKELEYWAQALASGLVSKQYAIQKVLKLTNEEAKRMLEEINGETSIETSEDRSDDDLMIYGE